MVNKLLDLNEDPLKRYYVEYTLSGKNERLFLERTSQWIVNYCKRRLHTDHDVVGDFYIYFYEKIRICLSRYHVHSHKPFTGFFATYIRHEFYNFQRIRKNNSLTVLPTEEINRFLDHSEPKLDVTEKLEGALHSLSPKYRFAVKLYFGFDISEAEWKILSLMMTKPIQQVQSLFEAKRQNAAMRRQDLSSRINQLNRLIHSANDTQMKTNRIAVWQRYKHRIARKIENCRHPFAFSEIGAMFGVSKSTICRRIDRSLQMMRNNLDEIPVLQEYTSVERNVTGLLRRTV